jgi:hypothetical protein
MTPCWRKSRPGGMRTHVVLATLLALSAQLSNADLRDTALTSDMAILELQRLQAMGPEAHDIVDAMLQGTTTLAVGHSVDSDHFAKHVARCAARADNRARSARCTHTHLHLLASCRSFEGAARGLRFHDVEDAPANEQERRELFTSQCVTLAALSAEASERRREVEADVGPTLGLTEEDEL